MICKCLLVLIIFFSTIPSKLFASDTLKISMMQADSMFLKKNYLLLASSLNIEAQKAYLIQARLYPNPVFTADINAYDPQNEKSFHVGKSGQKVFQLEQIILLGGKRKVQIDLAKTNSEIAEIEFYNLVRQLKFQLHSSLFYINEHTILIDKYNKQISMMDTILTAHEIQEKKGNVTLKDVVRLKGAYLDVLTDRAEVYKLMYEEVSKVQTLLQTDKFIDPLIEDDDFSAAIKEVNFNELYESAMQNRPDYLLSMKNKKYSEQFLSLQKRMAVPDINLFTSYDQRGGAFQDQLNLGISVPLTLWNRNQGNIKAAANEVKKAEYETEAVKSALRSEIQNFYSVYQQAILEYQKVQKLYNQDFDITLQGISKNFQKGNVSLLEFVDFFEGYNNAMAEIAKIKISLAISSEQLFLSTGKQ